MEPSFEAWIPVFFLDIASTDTANLCEIVSGVFPSFFSKLDIPLIFAAMLGIVKTSCVLLHGA